MATTTKKTPPKVKPAKAPPSGTAAPSILLPYKPVPLSVLIAKAKAKQKPTIQHHLVACWTVLPKPKKMNPSLVPAPSYMGWAALHHHTDIQEGDALIQPYIQDSIHCVHPEKSCTDVGEWIGEIKENVYDQSWCLYRPLRKPGKWIQLKSPSHKASRGDRLMAPGHTSQDRIKLVRDGMDETDIGVVVYNRAGQTLHEIRASGFDAYTLWTKVLGGASEESSGLVYRLPGNDEYSRPLPLP